MSKIAETGQIARLVGSRNPRNYYWELDEDELWQFKQVPAIARTEDLPRHWKYREVCREIYHFPPITTGVDFTGDPTIEAFLRHYQALSNWLVFRLAESGSDRDELRKRLYTDFIDLKPHADLSFARREFAYQLFPRSPLAQKAESEEHLWFCMEYSSCLAKLTQKLVTKSDSRTATSLATQTMRRAINAAAAGDQVNLLTIDYLKASGEDWRLYVDDLLISEAIRLISEEDGDKRDFVYHTRRFVGAIEHFNNITGHSNRHITTKSLVAQTPTQATPARRGRGRPPKGNCKVL